LFSENQKSIKSNLNLKVVKNEIIAKNTFLMKLTHEFFYNEKIVPRAGQFINIKLSGYYLRRPMSVCDFEEGFVSIIYKIVGNGTRALSQINSGSFLDTLLPLGNWFNTSDLPEKIVLIGGGTGLAPLYFLAKTLKKLNKNFTVCAGFGTSEEIFLLKDFSELGEFRIATADGSFGTVGMVTDLIKNSKYEYYFTCGPHKMMMAVREKIGDNGQISMEERMACGFGVCMGCAKNTKFGNKLICTNGPVFKSKYLKY
jgi:dihydroorotate dehydrogenase electron transfer subunit